MQRLELERNESGFLEPVNEEDIPAFRHCTEGSQSITYGAYQDLYREIFRLHNVETIIKDI